MKDIALVRLEEFIRQEKIIDAFERLALELRTKAHIKKFIN